MESLINLLSILGIFAVGGFFFLRRFSHTVDLPITQNELNKIKENKENELREQDPEIFIDDNLSNSDTIDDIKRTSDDRFDTILDKHRKGVD